MRAQEQRSQTECINNPACLALFNQAQKQSTAGQLAEAFDSYRQAYEILPDPRLLFSLARILHKQGQTKEAAVYYRQFIDSHIDDQAQIVKAQEYLAQCTPSPPVVPVESKIEAKPPIADPIIPPPRITPVYKRWWLWTGVGVVAAGVAIGIGLGVYTRFPELSNLPTARPFDN